MNKKIIGLIIVIHLLIAINPFMPIIKGATWYDGYNYRKTSLVNNMTGAGTDYQVYYNLHEGSGIDDNNTIYLENHCTNFWNDIDWCEDDHETKLDYWIEPNSTGSTAHCWVEITRNLDYIDQELNIYYGKSGQESQSNAITTDIAQLREHKRYALYNVNMTFSIVNGSVLECMSYDDESLGYGHVFWTVPTDWLDGKYLRWLWNGTVDTDGIDTESVAIMQIFDGSYDRHNSTEFPTGDSIIHKGYGSLLNFEAPTPGGEIGAWGPETQDQLIDLENATLPFVTIMFRTWDIWEQTNITNWLYWLEVNGEPNGFDPITACNFYDSVQMELTGTTGDYGLERESTQDENPDVPPEIEEPEEEEGSGTTPEVVSVTVLNPEDDDETLYIDYRYYKWQVRVYDPQGYDTIEQVDLKINSSDVETLVHMRWLNDTGTFTIVSGSQYVWEKNSYQADSSGNYTSIVFCLMFKPIFPEVTNIPVEAYVEDEDGLDNDWDDFLTPYDSRLITEEEEEEEEFEEQLEFYVYNIPNFMGFIGVIMLVISPYCFVKGFRGEMNMGWAFAIFIFGLTFFFILLAGGGF